MTDGIFAEPWARQDGESNAAFAAFQTYRGLGPKRSLRRVAEDLHLKSLSRIERWSASWQWVQRAQAWDNELDRISRESQRESIKEMKERHIKLAKALQAKAVDKLNELDGPRKLTATQMLQAIDLAVKIERQAMSEIVEERQSEAPEAGRIARLLLGNRAAMAKTLDAFDLIAEDELRALRERRKLDQRRHPGEGQTGEM
jgi:hypothetical protein